MEDGELRFAFGIKLNAFVYAGFFCLFAYVVPITSAVLTILKITL